MNRNISIEAPVAARIFFLFTLDAKTVADGMEKIGVSGETYDKMAEDWVNANETIWRGWLK